MHQAVQDDPPPGQQLRPRLLLDDAPRLRHGAGEEFAVGVDAIAIEPAVGQALQGLMIPHRVRPGDGEAARHTGCRR